jgi:esterase/lipase
MNKLIEFKNKEGEVLRGIFSDEGSSEIVFCIHGFEKTATTEAKFKRLSDELSKNSISSFRFDFSGCGFSGGDFKDMMVEKITDELFSAIKKVGEDRKISIVCHSLAGCVLAGFKEKYPKIVFEKIILLAPALNQKELLRYYFAVSRAKRIDKNLEVNWQNWKEYFFEEEFLKSYESEGRMSKANYFPKGYFEENKEKDYSSYFFGNEENILHIHGDKDSAVPKESVNINFKNMLIVKGGDHDMERPTMQSQWLKKTVEFLVEK